MQTIENKGSADWAADFENVVISCTRMQKHDNKGASIWTSAWTSAGPQNGLQMDMKINENQWKINRKSFKFNSKSMKFNAKSMKIFENQRKINEIQCKSMNTSENH